MTYVGDTDRPSFLTQTTINTEELQRIQDVYAQLTNLFIFSVNQDGERITEMSGNPHEIDRVLGLVTEQQVVSILRRVMESSVEEQIVEDTGYSNVKIASIAVRSKGKLAFGWFICAILDEQDDENAVRNVRSTTSYVKFIKSVDLLREISKKVLANAYLAEDAVAESKRIKSSELEMIRTPKKSEAMAEIVQLLDSDESFEEVSNKVLHYAGRYVQISHGYILRPNVNGKDVDILGVYIREGQLPLENVARELPLDDLYAIGDKPVVVSSKTKIEEKRREWLNSIGVTALVALPVFINHAVAMYLFFVDNTVNKIWELEEIKFFGDAARVLQNILTKRIQKNSLASSYKSLEAILDNVGSAIYVKDMETNEVLFANRIFKNTFEYEMRDGTIERLFESKQKYNTNASYLEIYYKEKSRWYDLHTTYIRWVDGRRVSLCSIFDVTDKKLYQQKIEQQANNDFLTGLYNRMCCERDLVKYIDEAKQHNCKGAVLYLDLDDFKHINDGLGHQYGDVLLKAISHSLQRIEGVENTCYRMGGDEFIIIVPDSSFERFEKIIEEIRTVFNKPWFLKGADYYCTTSVGIVTFPDEGETVQDLIKKADIAMYEAKKSGKNRMAYYAENADSASNRRLDMEKSMRDATAEGYREFEVYYQPIVDIRKTGSPCTGAEALIRWNSSKLGFVSPADFIPLAEYLGLINPIGNYVLREACVACKRWNESGHPYYKVNVNLSVVQLLQNDIVQIVEEIIKETGINPRNLTLEVTESLAINDMERMKQILGNIKRLGVRIALDDFGTGYSSLSHIREIPLDVIKVDQSFVTELAVDQYAQAFVKMVGELATALGVKICVEGVETAEQFKMLENMNVRLVQGYYFDKPMPREQFEEKYVHNDCN